MNDPKGYAQMWTDGGGDPTFDEIDGFLLAHFNARAVYVGEAASERPPVDPLREALIRRLAERVHGDESHAGSPFADCPHDPCSEIRAALASPAAPPEGLDVERLARAMVNADLSPAEPVVDADRREAEDIAAEYQRLGEGGK